MRGSAHEFTSWNNGFIIQRKIQDFEQQLMSEINVAKRGALLEHIAEEKARLAKLRKA